MPLINLTLSPFTGITNKIVVLAKEASNLAAVVTYQEFDFPHTLPRNVSLLVDNPVPHVVEVYETDGYPVLGTLLGSFTNDAGKTGRTVIYSPIYLVAGRGNPNDPAVDDYSFTHPDLVGRVAIIFYRRDAGEPLHPDDEYTFTSGTGTVSMVDVANTFISGERLTIFVQPETANVDATVTTLDYFTGIVEVTEDITVTQVDHNKKLLYCISDTTTLRLTLDPIATFANKALIGFKTSYGDPDKPGTGNQKQMSIVFDDATDYAENEEAIYLGQKEYISLIKLDNKWHVINEKWGIDHVGELTYGDINLLNSLPEDGELYSREEYPRYWNYINNLPPSQLVNDADWVGTLTNRGLHSSGDGSTTFRMPLGFWKFRRSIFDIIGTDTTRVPSLPGGVQSEDTGPHRHFTVIDKTYSASGFPAAMTALKSIVNRYFKSGSGAESYILSPDTDEPTVGRTSNGGGTETRPINLGYIPLRRI